LSARHLINHPLGTIAAARFHSNGQLATRLDLLLKVHGQLFAQKEVLRGQLRPRLTGSRHELEGNSDEAQNDLSRN
jgi:hypothetical protein